MHVRRRAIPVDEHQATGHASNTRKSRRQEEAASDEEDEGSNAGDEQDSEADAEDNDDESEDDSEGSDAEGSSSDDGEESPDSEDSDDEEEAPAAPQSLAEASPFSDPTMQGIADLGPLPLPPPRNVRLSIRHDKIKRRPRSTLLSRQAPAVPLPAATIGGTPPMPGVTAPALEEIDSQSSSESDGISSESSQDEGESTTGMFITFPVFVAPLTMTSRHIVCGISEYHCR
jgi:hypothetical protein